MCDKGSKAAGNPPPCLCEYVVNDQPVCEQWLPRAHDPMHFLKLVDMCQPSESDRVSVFVSNILLACFVHLSALSERPPGWMRFPFIMQCFNDFH